MATVSDDQKLATAGQLLGTDLLASLLANLDTAAKSLDDAGVESKERKTKAADEDEDEPEVVEKEDDDEDEDEDEPAFAKKFGGVVSKALTPIMKEMAEIKAMQHSHETSKTEKSQQGQLVEAFKQALAENNRVLAKALAASVQGLQVQTTKSAVQGALAELTSLTKEVQKAAKPGTKKTAVISDDVLDDEPEVDGKEKAKLGDGVPLSDFFNFVNG